MGNLVPVKLSEPPWTPLLKGVTLFPQRMLVVKAVSKFASAVAIWVSRSAGSYTDCKVPAPKELATPALAPVFKGVGSKPPIGMPWAPKAITRTTSELSRPILIDCWRVIGQISCASGSLVVLGLDSRGVWSGMVAESISALLISLSSSATRPPRLS
jgi:hypothetical protein